jgi:hypothetical protein
VEPHLSREIREGFFSAFKSNSKECIRQGLGLCIFRAYHLSESESEWAFGIVAFLAKIVKALAEQRGIYWLTGLDSPTVVTLIFVASPGRLESQKG